MKKLILTVAPVSADAPKMDPAATARDVIRSVAEGASIVHLHVRDENTRLTDDLTALKKTVEIISAESDAIIQVSTGGVSQMTIEQRCAPLYYDKVEMASLNVGSVNLGEAVYQNPMRDVRYCAEQLVKQGILPETEIFEIGMIHTLIELSRTYKLKKPMLLNMILGVKGAAPATVDTLIAMRSFIPEDAMWGFSHSGRGNFDMAMAAVFLGASFVRVGFEDSCMLDDQSIAGSNADILRKLAHMVRTCGIQIATPKEAREILGLKGR